MKVELVYDSDCPNVNNARAQLLQAFTQAGLSPRWQEWNRSDPSSPSYARHLGSPTILVNGKDIADAPASDGSGSCRIYSGDNGQLQGVPSTEVIVAALKQRHLSSWKNIWAMIPGIGVSFLPNLSCPACWPVYAGILTTFGLGFLLTSKYLFSVATIFLALAVAALGFRARSRHGFGPFGLGMIASGSILLGKFYLGHSLLTYGGITGLLAASIWNLWPVRSGNVRCSSCLEGDENIKRKESV